jgi:hypothetical protein
MGLVELVEFRKTFSLLKNDILTVTSILRDIRRHWKRYKKYGSTFDEIATNYLKIRYGYTPLLMTIKSLMDFKEKTTKRYTSRGFSSASDSASLTGQINGSAWLADWETKVSKQLDVRAGVLYDYQFTLADQLGLSPKNIPAAMYELIPFSFVVDWAVNLGDWIQAVTPKAGVNYLASWVVTREVTQIERRASFSPIQLANYTRTDNRYLSWFETTIETIRTPSAQPALAFKHLNYNVHDLKHGLDAIALLKQVYRSGTTLTNLH